MKVGDVILQKYEIEELISGDGTSRKGMSNLYKARDRNLGSAWAIKEIIMNPDGKISKSQASIIKEAQIMRKLNHPSIPRIVSIEKLLDSNGTNKIVIIMDWVDGRSVGEWIRSGKQLGIERSLAIIKAVCGVTSYLHTRPQPIFYRDMKPENIMYDAHSKRVMLLDFGISVELKEENPVIEFMDRMGTKGYYDPLSLGLSKKEKEQGVKERRFDLRSDIYSLGWTMFHILTGIHPYSYQKSKKQQKLEITRDIREYNPSFSDSLAKIIIKATEPNPKKRYQSVEELLVALEDIEKTENGSHEILKRRVRTTFAIGAIGVALMLASYIPYKAYQNDQKSTYEELLVRANRSADIEDIQKVIELKPSDIGNYFSLLESIKADGMFSKDEEELLLELLTPNTKEIEANTRFKELSFEIGKLYWLYSEEKDSQEKASRWFKEAKGYNELADVYYSIGSFPTEITKAANEGSDSGKYKKQWDLLTSVQGQSELVELQVASALVYLVETYPYRLKSDGISVDTMKAEMEVIKNLASSVASNDSRASIIASKLLEQMEEAEKAIGGFE